MASINNDISKFDGLNLFLLYIENFPFNTLKMKGEEIRKFKWSHSDFTYSKHLSDLETYIKCLPNTSVLSLSFVNYHHHMIRCINCHFGLENSYNFVFDSYVCGGFEYKNGEVIRLFETDISLDIIFSRLYQLFEAHQMFIGESILTSKRIKSQFAILFNNDDKSDTDFDKKHRMIDFLNEISLSYSELSPKTIEDKILLNYTIEKCSNPYDTVLFIEQEMFFLLQANLTDLTTRSKTYFKKHLKEEDFVIIIHSLIRKFSIKFSTSAFKSVLDKVVQKSESLTINLHGDYLRILEIQNEITNTLKSFESQVSLRSSLEQSNEIKNIIFSARLM